MQENAFKSIDRNRATHVRVVTQFVAYEELHSSPNRRSGAHLGRGHPQDPAKSTEAP